MKDLNSLAQNLLEARTKSLKNFNKIALTREAAKLVARLFYNPDCISLVNLDDLIVKDKILLRDLSKYMLTAAPSTLANYANKHHKVLLHHTDIIDCFAIDHQLAIKDNKIDRIYNPEYALSHILLFGHIIRLFEINNRQFADINNQINTRGVGFDSPGVGDLLDSDSSRMGIDSSRSRALVFKKVLIPKDLIVKKGDLVWHHFGVVIDKYDNENKVLINQLDSPYFRHLDSKASRLIIDFSDKKIFHRDILGKIIFEQENLKNRKRIISDPSISKIELPTDSKIKFIH